MGKEWLSWGGAASFNNSSNTCRSTKRGKKAEKEGTHTPSGCISAFFHLLDIHPLNLALNHQQQPTFKPEPFLQEEPTVLKGVEAPRNSLEQEDAFLEVASLPPLSTIKKCNNADLNIQMGIQIKTSVEKRAFKNACGTPRLTDDLSSESSSSPSTKTPNLVARLMGLDLLPAGSCSPSLSASTSNSLSRSQHHYSQAEALKQELRSRQLLHTQSSSKRYSFDGGSRSLPETPRISLGRKSDVDHHRLSLQINKENIGVELDSSNYNKLARRTDCRLQEESKSPGHYGRQIVKQVKEGVSRKVGLDITNTIKNKEHQRRDDNIMLLKAKKSSKVLTGDELCSSMQTITASASCSPRFRFLEPKNSQSASSASKKQNSQSPKVSSLPEYAKVFAKPKSQVTLKESQQQPHHQQQILTQKCNKLASERCLKKSQQASDAIKIKQEEPFIRPSTTSRAKVNSDKKCKKTELSNELLHITVPTLVPVKKDPKLSQKQAKASDALSSKRCTRLPSSLGQSYGQQKATHMLTVQKNSKSGSDNNSENIHSSSTSDCSCCNVAPTNSFGDGSEYYEYISRILKRTGIDKNTPVSSSYSKWYSSTHPLDPSIFHHLELFHATTRHSSKLSPKCNRKLLFQLVDELLVEILKPTINLKPWVNIVGLDYEIKGSELVEELCKKIESFPSADCRVLEDIDSLINKDISRRQFWERSIAYEEEGEGVVAEVEREIVDTLVHETAMLVFVFGLV